jgi:multidrug transporter EmrE-like cation transporter
MQVIIIFSIAILTTVTSQLLFKKGMFDLAGMDFSLNNVYILIKHVLSNPFLLGGLFSYAISFLLWLFVISKIKLSLAYPITSINFVLILLASYYFFGEKLSSFQYFGIALIVIGVIALSRG